jgi:hypothetical protein
VEDVLVERRGGDAPRSAGAAVEYAEERAVSDAGVDGDVADAEDVGRFCYGVGVCGVSGAGEVGGAGVEGVDEEWVLVWHI